MPGIPLLFTDSGAPADTIYKPLPGLFLSDELYLGDDVFLDDGPTAYALWNNVSTNVAPGITTVVTPVPAEAVMPVPAFPTVVGDIVEPSIPVPAAAFMPVPQFGGQDIVESVTPAPAVAFMPVPGTSGGSQVILVPSVRELPPLRLTVNVTSPGGRRFRWAEDDPNPANVPSGLRFSDTMPGGFESFDCTLPRKVGQEGSDLERLSTVNVVGAGGRTAWEGRLERAPRSSGDEVSVSPSGVGWQAALEDDKSAAEVYVDADLSSWGAVTVARSLSQSGGGITLEGSVSVPGVGPTDKDGNPIIPAEPALKLALTDTWGKDINGATLAAGAPGYRKSSEATYEFPDTSSGFGQVHFWSLLSQAGGPWNHQFWTSSDGDVLAPFEQSANYGGADTISTWSPNTKGNQYLSVRWYYNAHPAGAEGAEFTNHLRRLTVIGNHGLVTRPIEGTTRPGLLASDIVRHAVGKWAPQLNVSSTSVMPSGFVIPHASFRELTTAGEIVRQVTRFGLQDWAVWSDRTFYWHERGANSRFWRARVGPAQLEETGPQVERLWESVIVQYSDVDGSTRTVGPVGSGADTESGLLKDTDPDNPANRAGITRRSLLTMGTSTAAAATKVGRRFLEEQKLLDSSGRARFVGHLESDKGVVHPYWAPRAGDYVSFIDAADSSPRRIVRTEKDHGTRTCSVDLDTPPEGLQALLERLGVGLTDLGFS